MQTDAVSLPSGTVTFVFTDIEGSTRLLKQVGDDEYGTLLSVHRRLVRDIFTAHEGQEIDTQGDAFFYSFVRARQAVAAAVEVTRAHAKATWPRGLEVRIRLGLHTGEPAIGDEGYTGLDVVRASRIAATGAGGQVLLSDTTRSIVAGDLPGGVALRPLGERQLKDLDRPEPIFELLIDSDAESTAAAEPSVKNDEPPAPAATPPEDRSPRDRIDRTRQTIEDRVLAKLEETIGSSGFPFGPPKPPRRPMTQEIARLAELREDGALTDAQYQRAVDRLLEDADPDAD
jgi:class 3 adenylate cyclase